jgi:RNA polymerase sigma factor (sigma-70 family)
MGGTLSAHGHYSVRRDRNISNIRKSSILSGLLGGDWAEKGAIWAVIVVCFSPMATVKKKTPKKSPKKPAVKEVDEKASGGFLKTRKSLIERLDNWEDRQGWNEFYQIYSQFLFRVARKAGLSDQEAHEAVQETFIGVAKNLSKKKFNVNGGSFKAWLMNQARWRIVDQFRGRKPESAFNRPGAPGGELGDRRTATLERFADPAGEKLERIWDLEWKESITELALKSLRNKVSPEQYQIFYLYVVKGWATNKVRDHLGVTATQVYLAKHRVGRLMKKEVERLEKQTI